jgi:hypothetical protein
MLDREDVVVILDKHFKLSDKGGVSDTTADAGSKNKSKSSGLGFDEQSRRAAEVIRAAGCVTFLLNLMSLTQQYFRQRKRYSSRIDLSHERAIASPRLLSANQEAYHQARQGRRHPRRQSA